MQDLRAAALEPGRYVGPGPDLSRVRPERLDAVLRYRALVEQQGFIWDCEPASGALWLADFKPAARLEVLRRFTARGSGQYYPGDVFTWDPLSEVSPTHQRCKCHITELLSQKRCTCGSYYGSQDDDMCRVCESIHCECSLSGLGSVWATEQWLKKEERYNRISGRQIVVGPEASNTVHIKVLDSINDRLKDLEHDVAVLDGREDKKRKELVADVAILRRHAASAHATSERAIKGVWTELKGIREKIEDASDLSALEFRISALEDAHEKIENTKLAITTMAGELDIPHLHVKKCANCDESKTTWPLEDVFWFVVLMISLLLTGLVIGFATMMMVLA